MITLNTFIKRFEDFAANHYFIRQFSFGAPEDVDLQKDGQYPLMHVIYTGASYDETTKTLDFEVYILDLPSHYEAKTERQKEVVSDAEQCAEDIISDIANGHNIFIDDENYEVTNASITPLAEEGSNVLAGILLDLSIQIPYDRSACDAPINGVLPDGGGFVYQRRGLLRVLTQDGSVDVASVNTIRVTNGTLINEGGGIVSIDTGGVDQLTQLSDVEIDGPADHEALVYDDVSGNWVNGAPAKIDFPVFNATASPIQLASVVAFTGAVQGDKPCVALAQATSALDVRTIVGVTSTRLNANTAGHVRPYGTIYNIPTNQYTLGTILYLSATTPGALTATAPTAPAPRIPVAIVVRVHAQTGRLFVRNWAPNYKLAEIADVGYNTPPVLNDVLAYDGTKWVNRAFTTATIPPVAGTPPPGGFKSVFFQDAAGALTTETEFNYTANTNTLAVDNITATAINGRTLATDAAKLDGIQAGAEVNVNADWNASSGDAQILNKPTFVASVSGSAPIVSSGGTTPALSITAATTTDAGSMSAADKLKLDGIASGAEVNQNAYANILVGATTISANSESDTLTLIAGANITLTPNAGSESITIAATGSTGVSSVSGTAPIVSSGGSTPAISITNATTSAAGAMSASDKSKLDGIAAGAEVNVNADWNAASGDAQILNKPTIPSQYSLSATNTTTTYTLAIGDRNEFMLCDSTSNFTITIPLNSSVAFDINTEIAFMQMNTGSVTIQGAAGVTLRTSQTAKTAKQYAVIAIKKIATDTWVCVGERQAI